MKILLSPAKSQDFSPFDSPYKSEIATFITGATAVMSVLKSYSVAEIKKLMKISDAIAIQTCENVEQWGSDTAPVGQALFSYSGEVFKCLGSRTLSEASLEKATSIVRILSGVYGILKPSEEVSPYRLEVKTVLSVEGEKNLYTFWRERVTSALNDELEEDEVILNLTSSEYSKMINWKEISQRVITPTFKVRKNGVLKTAAVWAKKGRGYLTRYLLGCDAITDDVLKGFKTEGFKYEESETEEFLFVKDI